MRENFETFIQTYITKNSVVSRAEVDAMLSDLQLDEQNYIKATITQVRHSVTFIPIYNINNDLTYALEIAEGGALTDNKKRLGNALFFLVKASMLPLDADANKALVLDVMKPVLVQACEYGNCHALRLKDHELLKALKRDVANRKKAITPVAEQPAVESVVLPISTRCLQPALAAEQNCKIS